MNLLNKVLIAPVVTIGLMLVLGAAGYWSMNSQQRALEELFNGRFSHSAVAADIGNHVLRAHSQAYRVMTWSASRGDGYIEKETKVLLADLDRNAAEFATWASGTNLSEEEKNLARQMVEQIVTYRKSIASAMDMATADINSGIMTMQSADENFKQLSESADKLVAMEKQLGKGDVDRSASVFQRMLTAGFIVLLASICVAGALSFYMARGIMRQIGGEPAYATEITRRIAAGDLSSQVRLTGNDSGSMLAGMKTMQSSIQALVTQIKDSTESIIVASKEITSGNADLSQRTEEQASSLEETASSMEELTSTVKQNAENARQANQLALGASSVAVKGGQVVGQVVETMSSINESSKKIVDIISVIDGIAFQTNILALNAAVEAARAGEQGRGFAVVATEVRNLAQRSAAAAKEIKTLIGDSVDKVGAGTKLVDEAGKTMEEIVTSVKRVTDIMSEITAASQEQSAGIEQVNQAITQMDEVTQQNAALVEEVAAAAESLEEQAQNLEAAVSVFKVGKAEADGVARSAEVVQMASARSAARVPAKNMSLVHSGKGKADAGSAAAAPRAKLAVGGGEEKWEEF